MRLYNSLTKQVEAFTPLADTISVYSCGPTVYNNLHIGNLSAFVYADLLRRVLKASYPDKKIRHVMNITDVDDKTIRDSQSTDTNPMRALLTFTRKYEQVFMDDMSKIGNDVSSMEFIRATDSIEDMLAIIRELYDNKIAYLADDGVYFSIEEYKQHGKTYGQLVHINESSTSNSRIQNDEYDKESAHDFALWKIAKNNEPSWAFELDGHRIDGRPGWHIECSAMSRKLLGQPFDIHTGGIDLKFPHHENEIAQSTACAEDPHMARFFVHNEHVLVDGKKMSKSVGNFYTLRDLEEKGFEPMAFRMLVLQGHYRNAVSFSWENLQAAKEELFTWRRIASLRWQTKLEQVKAKIPNSPVSQLMDGMIAVAGLDLKIPAAFTYVSEFRANADQYLKENMLDHEDLSQITILFRFIDSLFGLNILTSTPDLSTDQKSTLKERISAREKSDFKKSDELRDALKEQGIQVLDTPSGQIWHYV